MIFLVHYFHLYHNKNDEENKKVLWSIHAKNLNTERTSSKDDNWD